MSKSINDVVEDYRARHVMEPIEAETHAHLIAHRILEGMKEPDCEFIHHATPCTKHVSHRLTHCRGQQNICQSGRAFTDEVMSDPAAICDECRRPVLVCWRIWSI